MASNDKKPKIEDISIMSLSSSGEELLLLSSSGDELLLKDLEKMESKGQVKTSTPKKDGPTTSMLVNTEGGTNAPTDPPKSDSALHSFSLSESIEQNDSMDWIADEMNLRKGDSQPLVSDIDSDNIETSSDRQLHSFSLSESIEQNDSIEWITDEMNISKGDRESFVSDIDSDNLGASPDPEFKRRYFNQRKTYLEEHKREIEKLVKDLTDQLAHTNSELENVNSQLTDIENQAENQ